jgi:HEAT repeat protein
MKSWILRAIVASVLSARVFADQDNAAKTQELAAVLQSPASLFEKARACQQLGEIGDKSAVSALAALLSDEHLSAYARSGLEGIPDPSAALALRTALGTLKGNLLAGVINSLAVLRDAQAVGVLRPLAEDPGSGVAREALFALGRIDTSDSVAVIRNALVSGPEATRADAAAACLLAAEKELAGGHADVALSLDDAVRSAKVPAVYRGAATRGAILAHGPDRIPFLLEQLRGEDPVARDAALLTIREIPGAALAEALNTEIAKAQSKFALQLLSALTDCHNAKSFRLLAARAAGGDPEMRFAAQKVLSVIAGPAQAGVLLKVLEADRTPAESDLAENTLERMESRAVDDSVLKALLAARDSRACVRLMELLQARGATNAFPELLRRAADSNEEVSIAAIGALGALADAGETPALITLATAVKPAAAKEAAERAICRAVARNGNEHLANDFVLGELQRSTNPDDKNRWARILSCIGDAGALPTLEELVKDTDVTVAANAIESLGNWPDPAPVDALLTVVNTSADSRLRQRALASVIRLASTAADEHQRSDAEIAGWMSRMSAAAQSIAERRQIASVLGRLKCVESFRLLEPWLNQPNLQAEAGVAVVQIAPALVNCDDSAAVKRALQTIAAAAQTPEIRDQAAKLADSIHPLLR